MQKKRPFSDDNACGAGDNQRDGYPDLRQPIGELSCLIFPGPEIAPETRGR